MKTTKLKNTVAIGMLAGLLATSQIGNAQVTESDVDNYWNTSQASVEQVDTTTTTKQEPREWAMDDALHEFIKNLPKDSHTYGDYAADDERTEEITNSYKQLFISMISQDKKMQEMGFCEEAVERYAMPRITGLKFEGKKTYYGVGGYSREDGDMHVNNDPKFQAHGKVHTLLHETAHVFGYAENAAELFGEVLTGSSSADVRYDWEYGSHQLRDIYNKARENNEESLFWESLSTEQGVRGMWDKYSPTYKKDGQDNQVMTFDEWQMIRGYSKKAVETGDFFRYPRLSNLSKNFEKACENSDDKKFIESLRGDISEVLNKAEKMRIEPSKAALEPDRKLSEAVYFKDGYDPNNIEHNNMLDGIHSLNNLGFCNTDIMTNVGEGIIDMAEGRVFEIQWENADEQTKQNNINNRNGEQLQER